MSREYEFSSNKRSMAFEEIESLVYISPEHTGRVKNKPDQRSDMYSLGIITLLSFLIIITISLFCFYCYHFIFILYYCCNFCLLIAHFYIYFCPILFYFVYFYIIGVILYEMISGAPPFHFDDALQMMHAHIARPPPPLPSSLSSFRDIVNTLLAKDPDRRYLTPIGLKVIHLFLFSLFFKVLMSNIRRT